MPESSAILCPNRNGHIIPAKLCPILKVEKKNCASKLSKYRRNMNEMHLIFFWLESKNRIRNQNQGVNLFNFNHSHEKGNSHSKLNYHPLFYIRETFNYQNEFFFSQTRCFRSFWKKTQIK